MPRHQSFICTGCTFGGEGNEPVLQILPTGRRMGKRVRIRRRRKEVKMELCLSFPYQAVRLFGPSATPCTEEVATFPRPRSKASAAVALGSAVDLAELLAVVGAFPPAAVFARLVAWCAVPLWLREVVHVDILRPRPRDDLLPLDGLDVAKVVVVQDADTALEDIWRREGGENYQGVRKKGGSVVVGEWESSHS